MSRSRKVMVVAGPNLLHSVTQSKAEQLCSEGKAERRSRFLIAMVDVGGCGGPTAVGIEGDALLKAFYGRTGRGAWDQPFPETAKEVEFLIRTRSPHVHAFNSRRRA